MIQKSMSLLLDTGVNSSLEVAGGLHGTSKERSGLLQGEREREREREDGAVSMRFRGRAGRDLLFSASLLSSLDWRRSQQP